LGIHNVKRFLDNNFLNNITMEKSNRLSGLLPNELLVLELRIKGFYPKNIDEFFQNLNFSNIVWLELSFLAKNNRLSLMRSKFDEKWLSRLPRLKWLDNIMKSPTIIDPDLFKHVPRLKHLVLHFNTLLDVDSLYKALKELQTLNLLGNKLNVNLNVNDCHRV